jgi:diaminopimelate decarboxylase
VRTGTQDSKFGFDLASGQALEAARRVAGLAGLRLRGLHAHLGSQLLDAEPYAAAVDRLLDLAAAVRAATDRELEELNVGGGVGIAYLPGEVGLSPQAFAATVMAAVSEGCRRRDLPPPVLGCEPGRAIVGEVGVAVYTVGSQKRVPGLPPYVAVDGGMGDNIRPALYGSAYRVVVANRMRDPAEERVTVVGRYCESGDFLAKDVPVPRLRAGDRLAMLAAGAYQLPMASNYNRVPRPAALLVRSGHADVILTRETYDDLLRQDRIPPHLAAPAAGPAVAAAAAAPAEDRAP